MKYTKQKGFTILELILSIFILSIAIAGIFSSFSLLILLSQNAADRLTGVYLGEEGLEVAINIRDTNWINNISWDQGLYPDCQQACQLDYTTSAEHAPKPWGIAGDYLNQTGGFYGYDSLNRAPTKFKRKITVTPLTDYAMKVNADVFWDQKPSVINPLGKQGHIASEVVLYNWH